MVVHGPGTVESSSVVGVGHQVTYSNVAGWVHHLFRSLSSSSALILLKKLMVSRSLWCFAADVTSLSETTTSWWEKRPPIATWFTGKANIGGESWVFHLQVWSTCLIECIIRDLARLCKVAAWSDGYVHRLNFIQIFLLRDCWKIFDLLYRLLLLRRVRHIVI